MTNAHTASELAQMQSLPLEAKIPMSKDRIKVWFEAWTRFEIVNLKTGKTRFETFDMRDQYEPPLKEDECIEREFIGSVYVSFSGGKDSTVLADLCAQVCQQYGYTLYLLFVNTGLEYPEIQKFVKTFAEWLRNKYCIEVVLDIVRPEMRFDEVLKKYGYPVISKEVSETISQARKSRKTGKYAYRMKKLNGELLDKDGNPSRYNIPQHKYLLDAPFDSSNECCRIMKKTPAKQYEKQTGRMALLGTMAHESFLRKSNWTRFGCNAFTAKRPTSAPMSFWTNQDVLHYIKQNDLPICSVYGDIVIDEETEFEGQMNLIDYLGCYEAEDVLKTTGRDRTGCIFCMFGCHLEKEPNRFQRLKQTHPRQYEYCIKGGEMVDGKWQPSKEGLGLGHVLDYIGVKYD